MAAKTSGISIAKLDEHEVVIPKNSSTRVAWWRVTLGKKITGTKKLRKYLPTERAAKQFIQDTLQSKTTEGHDAFAITPAFRQEARKCSEMLDQASERVGRRLALTEAVGFFLRHALPTGGTVTFDQARQAFITSRRSANLKERYIRNLSSQFEQLAKEFGKTRVNLIVSNDLESWLSEREQSPKTRNNYIITLRTFFDYCVAQKWCAENPATSLNKSKVEDGPAGILTISEATRLLHAAANSGSSALPTIAIQLFSGLRRSEACALDWSEIRPDFIEVSARKAKTRSRRVVDIQPNLATWLKPLWRESGPVFSGSEDTYNEALRNVVALANEKGKKAKPQQADIVWKHNCLRHTCASMHLAQFENEALTAMQMGHTVDILHRHYKGLVTREEAKRYWAVSPSADTNNVVPFKTAEKAS